MRPRGQGAVPGGFAPWRAVTGRGWLAALLLVAVPACGTEGPDTGGLDAGGAGDVAPGTRAEERAAEETVVAFFDAITAYDYDGLRRVVTDDFELVEDTLVLDLGGFIAFIEPFEDRGATITYELSGFNTEVRGPVAWTRYRNEGVLRTGEEELDLEWLESAVLLKVGADWRIDRLHSTPVTRE